MLKVSVSVLPSPSVAVTVTVNVPTGAGIWGPGEAGRTATVVGEGGRVRQRVGLRDGQRSRAIVSGREREVQGLLSNGALIANRRQDRICVCNYIDVDGL